MVCPHLTLKEMSKAKSDRLTLSVAHMSDFSRNCFFCQFKEAMEPLKPWGCITFLTLSIYHDSHIVFKNEVKISQTMCKNSKFYTFIIGQINIFNHTLIPGVTSYACCVF